MSKDLNKCLFTGRLGKDPEVKYFQSGDAFANLSLAVSDGYKNKDSGEWVDKTEWIQISVIGKLAEVAGEYLATGSRILVEGRFQTRSWEQDGVTRYISEIRVDSFGGQLIFLDSKGDKADGGKPPQQQKPQRQAQRKPPPMVDDFEDDDIPF